MKIGDLVHIKTIVCSGYGIVLSKHWKGDRYMCKVGLGTDIYIAYKHELEVIGESGRSGHWKNKRTNRTNY